MDTENTMAPTFAGFRGMKLADLPREFAAGLTIAALVTPLNIGYAQVAKLPPGMGLYVCIPLLLAECCLFVL